MARIASLHVYPVKSCRGIDLQRARVTATGLEWDRRWMIVDANRRFVSQRENPRLAGITVTVGSALRLSASGLPELAVDPRHGGERYDVRIWDDVVPGIDAGDDVADWLLAALGAPLRLVRIDDAAGRNAEPAFAGPGPNPVTFADAYPFLLISKASLEDLNHRLPAPLPMNRFRPNIVVEGVPAYAEDAMSVFRFGRVAIRGVKLCTRCSITTTDQETFVRDAAQEPLRTLKTYRYDRALRGVVFGQNCVIAGGVGETLTIGTELTID